MALLPSRMIGGGVVVGWVPFITLRQPNEGFKTPLGYF